MLSFLSNSAGIFVDYHLTESHQWSSKSRNQRILIIQESILPSSSPPHLASAHNQNAKINTPSLSKVTAHISLSNKISAKPSTPKASSNFLHHHLSATILRTGPLKGPYHNLRTVPYFPPSFPLPYFLKQQFKEADTAKKMIPISIPMSNIKMNDKSGIPGRIERSLMIPLPIANPLSPKA
jgi:hypothetical protein